MRDRTQRIGRKHLVPIATKFYQVEEWVLMKLFSGFLSSGLGFHYTLSVNGFAVASISRDTIKFCQSLPLDQQHDLLDLIEERIERAPALVAEMGKSLIDGLKQSA